MSVEETRAAILEAFDELKKSGEDISHDVVQHIVVAGLSAKMNRDELITALSERKISTREIEDYIDQFWDMLRSTKESRAVLPTMRSMFEDVCKMACSPMMKNGEEFMDGFFGGFIVGSRVHPDIVFREAEDLGNEKVTRSVERVKVVIRGMFGPDPATAC